MSNSWLNSSKPTMEKLRKILISAEYLPEYQTFPIRTIEFLLNGAEAEIIRLQKLLDEKE